jgi:hypothetical protein
MVYRGLAFVSLEERSRLDLLLAMAACFLKPQQIKGRSMWSGL